MKDLLRLIFTFLLLVNAHITYSQTDIDDQTTKKLYQIIDYHYFLLNTIGNSETTEDEKYIIINKTYLKSFLTSKVQIEDDLDESRTVVTNKDVQAYLKDVDFFFSNATFNYRLKKMKVMTKNKKIVYLVEVERHLKATTINAENLDNKISRFFEINKIPDTNELKIASIYTQKITIDEEYANWWKNISEEWKSVIRKKCNFTDNPKSQDYEKIADIDSLDIQDIYLIENLEPLAKLYKLTYLDISNTKLADVSELKYCSKLKYLKAKNANINNLNTLRFSSSIIYLDIEKNKLENFEFLKGLTNLEYINLSYTNILDQNPTLDIIKNCEKLKEIGLNGIKLRNIAAQVPKFSQLITLSVKENNLKDLYGIEAYTQLEEIDFSDNLIISIDELTNNTGLKVIKANDTYLNDFNGIEKMVLLEKIEYDVDFENEHIISQISFANENIKIKYNTTELRDWWYSLSSKHKKFFVKYYNISENPSIDALITVRKIKKIDLKKSTWVKDLTFLEPLVDLEWLNISQTNAKNLKPLSSNSKLKTLIIEGLSIYDFSDIRYFKNIETINISNGRIKSKKVFKLPKTIKQININETIIDENVKINIIKKYPDVNWIYDSKELEKWWKNLPINWKKMITKKIKEDDNVKLSNDEIHLVRQIKTLSLKNKRINDISPCSKFDNLKVLDIATLKINTLEPISNLKNVEELNISHNPITSLSPVHNYKKLKILNISNTSVDNLDDVKTLFNLETLNLGGTKINELKQVTLLSKLKEINISNTQVKSLKSIQYLPSLESVICYNSRVKQKSIDQFKEHKTDVKVVYE